MTRMNENSKIRCGHRCGQQHRKAIGVFLRRRATNGIDSFVEHDAREMNEHPQRRRYDMFASRLTDTRWPARVGTQNGRRIRIIGPSDNQNRQVGSHRNKVKHVARGEQRSMIQQNAIAASIRGIGRTMGRGGMLRFSVVLGTRHLHARHRARHRHNPRNGRHHDNKRHGQHRQPSH